jgi:hypothetical protein
MRPVGIHGERMREACTLRLDQPIEQPRPFAAVAGADTGSYGARAMRTVSSARLPGL